MTTNHSPPWGAVRYIVPGPPRYNAGAARFDCPDCCLTFFPSYYLQNHNAVWLLHRQPRQLDALDDELPELFQIARPVLKLVLVEILLLCHPRCEAVKNNITFAGIITKF